MPSPVAHLGAGYVIYRQSKNRLPEDRRRFWVIPLQVVAVAALSLLPDLDTIPAVLFGDMQRYHNNISHSLFFAIPVALVCAGLFTLVYRSNFWTWFFVSLVSYEIHIIMDFFTAERGVMLFWPLLEARFASPVKLFMGLQWGLGWFSIWHLWTFLTEGIFCLVVIFLSVQFEKRAQGRNSLKQKEQHS